MAQRYALYYAPEHGSPLASFGARWLGRDAGSGAPCVQASVPGVPDDLVCDITKTPRRYGFHATLKPPFALAEGRSPEGLLRSVAQYAASRAPVSAPALELAGVGSFLALVPRGPSKGLEILAEECVTLFDGFRARAGEEELARRRAGGLTPRQETLLKMFGYPYVLDEFRFHLTLTSSLNDEVLKERLARHLKRALHTMSSQPLTVREICVFRQNAPDKPFTILKRFPLSGQREHEPVRAKAV